MSVNVYDLHKNTTLKCDKCGHFKAQVLVQFENGLSETRCHVCK